ncbi:Hypothetical protein EIN_269950, partial [Entamoeba invadens IP1]
MIFFCFLSCFFKFCIEKKLLNTVPKTQPN